MTTTRGLPALAVALDAWRRGIVGRSKANHPRVEPALDALEMAIGRRRPGNVIDHGDQGRQCASPPFADRRDEAGARPLMGSVGDGCDNAPREGFLATLERERLDRRRFASQAAAGMARFSFIEGWRNPVRSHFVLGCRSPMARAAAMDQIAAKPS